MEITSMSNPLEASRQYSVKLMSVSGLVHTILSKHPKFKKPTYTEWLQNKSNGKLYAW